MSLKLFLAILFFTFVIFASPAYSQAGDYIWNQKLDEIVTVKPNSAFLIRPTYQHGKLKFMPLQLPEEIIALKAFVWDPVHHIPLFSAGVPNKIFAYTGHDDNFDIIVEDVSNVTSMEIDLDNELLLWTDSGKNVVEKMSLRTLERSTELSYDEDDNFRVINETISISYPGCRNNCNQPLWGKVFKKHFQFREKTHKTYKLMKHPKTGRYFTASWDGTQVVFSSERANNNDFATKQFEDHTYMNLIYCGIFNGVALLSM